MTGLQENYQMLCKGKASHLCPPLAMKCLPTTTRVRKVVAAAAAIDVHIDVPLP